MGLFSTSNVARFNAKVEAAREIYRRAIRGESSAALASEFSVKPSFVADIKRGTTYASVTGHRR